jgi:hypothetical protein
MSETKRYPVRLIQMVEGKMVRSDFGPEVDVIAAMEIRGYEFTKLNTNPSNRAELQGQPKFSGLNGPMWDGDAIRYEDPKSYAALSQ